MFWDERQDTALLGHYQRLVALRHQYVALRRGLRLNVTVEVLDAGGGDEAQVGAYLRFMERHDELKGNTAYLLIVLNNSERAVKMHIRLVEQLKAAGIKMPVVARMRDVLAIQTGQEFELIDGSVELTLAAWGAVVLALIEK
jgi:hypothetical protein